MKLILFPDARLTMPCALVTPADFTPEFHKQAQKMLAHCREWKGYALAAPQVGIMKRFFVVLPAPQPGTKGYRENGYPTLPEHPLIICNPVISNPEGKHVYPESCLSMPGVVGNLTRSASFTLTYATGGSDPMFENMPRERTMECRGLLARIIQHEIDHLDGTLFVERLDPITKNKIYPAINRLRKR